MRVSCTCVSVTGEPVPPEVDLARNAEGVVIFVGTALSVIPDPSGSAESDAYRPLGSTTTFFVEGYWGASPLSEVIDVKTPGPGGACGFDFKEGQCYLVQAWLEKGAWKATICSMTGLARANRSVLEKLALTDGPAKIPRPNQSG